MARICLVHGDLMERRGPYTKYTGYEYYKWECKECERARSRSRTCRIHGIKKQRNGPFISKERGTEYYRWSCSECLIEKEKENKEKEKIEISPMTRFVAGKWTSERWSIIGEKHG